MPPDEPTDEERQEQLPQDGETPFRPADPSPAAPSQPIDDTGTLSSTHPATDTNIQPEELYDEGVAGAAEVSEPPAPADAVEAYTPPQSGDSEDNSQQAS